eukprot:gene1572-4720_t
MAVLWAATLAALAPTPVVRSSAANLTSSFRPVLLISVGRSGSTLTTELVSQLTQGFVFNEPWYRHVQLQYLLHIETFDEDSASPYYTLDPATVQYSPWITLMHYFVVLVSDNSFLDVPILGQDTLASQVSLFLETYRVACERIWETQEFLDDPKYREDSLLIRYEDVVDDGLDILEKIHNHITMFPPSTPVNYTNIFARVSSRNFVNFPRSDLLQHVISQVDQQEWERIAFKFFPRNLTKHADMYIHILAMNRCDSQLD